MNGRPLCELLASIVDAMHRCDRSGNIEWASKHRFNLDSLAKNFLPSGSGIDRGTTFAEDNSSRNKLVFDMSFHHMDENGMYDGWTDHTIIVTPDLVSRINVRITGQDRNGIKDYLHEVYFHTLTTDVVFSREKGRYVHCVEHTHTVPLEE